MKVRRIDFSPDEFLVGTRQLTDAEVGMYWRACSLIYSHGGPIPVTELQRWCRCGSKFTPVFKRLVSYGKLQLNEGLIDNKRAQEELLSASKRVLDARLNGSKGGRPRKKINEMQNPEVFSHTNPSAKAEPQPSPSHPSSSPPSDSPYNYTPTLPHLSDAYASDADEPRQPAIPVDPVKEVFDRGVHLLGNRRSLIGKMVKQYGEVAVLEAIVTCENERPVDPASFFVACLKNSSPRENGHAAQRSPVEKLWSGAKLAFEEFDRRQGDSGSGSASLGPLLDRK